MYRTGDRARFWADGNIEFRGRLDGQVKIRGFRVETGEIEEALRKHPVVREAVVVARETGGHGKQLTAYVVLKRQAAAEELREHLIALLPHYMVPAVFVAIEQLPLTTNGKLDRRALPDPKAAQADDSQRFEPPATELEKQIAAIWRKVLRSERVGRHDNFFALGGDSLMSVEVVAQAAAEGLDISPRHVFQHPTVAELAQVARPLDPKAPTKAAHGSTGCNVPLTPIQHWLFGRNLRDPENYNITFLFDVDATVEPRRLLDAIRRVAERHDGFALRFDQIGGRWRQRLAEPAVGCEQRDVGDVAADRQTAAMQSALFDLRRSLDLTHGPLMKTLLFRLGDGWKLGLIVHHLIFDAASLRIWLDDVEAAYRQIVAPPAPSGTGYCCWARALAAYTASSASGEWLDQWLAMPWACVKPLPLDFPTGANTYRTSASVQQTVAARCTRSLLHELPRRLKAPAGEVLLAAWGRAMATWARQEAVLIDVTGHGRERFLEDVDASKTIGYLTTNSPAILRPQQDIPDPRPPEQSWGIQRYLCPDAAITRQLAALPVPQVKFNFQGTLWHCGSLLRGPLNRPVRGALHPDNIRAYPLNVELAVMGGQLQCQCVYGRHLHRRPRIEALVDSFVSELHRAAEQSGEAAQSVPVLLAEKGGRP